MDQGPSFVDSQATMTLEQMIHNCELRDLSNEVEVGLVLGEGSFGTVHRGQWKDKGVALKSFKINKAHRDKAKLKRQAMREMKKSAVLFHPNIVEFYGYVSTPGLEIPAMVLKLCERGNADDFLREHGPLVIGRALSLARETATGLEYLHSLGIVHGDLKSQNILISDGGTVQLCDFGLACLPDWPSPSNFNNTTLYCGTLRYRAPELLKSKSNKNPRPSFQGDIYALGCVIHEFMTRRYPFHNCSSPEEIIEEIQDGTPPAPTPPDLRTQSLLVFWEHLQACWSRDPSSRPRANEVKPTLQALCDLSRDEGVFHSRENRLVNHDKRPNDHSDILASMSNDNDSGDVVGPHEVIDHIATSIPMEEASRETVLKELRLIEVTHNSTKRSSLQLICDILTRYTTHGNPPNLQLLAFKSILASILRFPLLRSLFTQHGTVYDSNIPQDIDWELPLQHQIAQANQEWLYYHQLVSYVVFGNTIAPLVDGVFDDLGRISDSKLHIVGELLPLISFWGISNHLGIVAMEYLHSVLTLTSSWILASLAEEAIEEILQVTIESLEKLQACDITIPLVRFKARSIDLLADAVLMMFQNWSPGTIVPAASWLVLLERLIRFLGTVFAIDTMPKSRRRGFEVQRQLFHMRHLPYEWILLFGFDTTTVYTCHLPLDSYINGINQDAPYLFEVRNIYGRNLVLCVLCKDLSIGESIAQFRQHCSVSVKNIIGAIFLEDRSVNIQTDDMVEGNAKLFEGVFGHTEHMCIVSTTRTSNVGFEQYREQEDIRDILSDPVDNGGILDREFNGHHRALNDHMDIYFTFLDEELWIYRILSSLRPKSATTTAPESRVNIEGVTILTYDSSIKSCTPAWGLDRIIKYIADVNRPEEDFGEDIYNLIYGDGAY